MKKIKRLALLTALMLLTASVAFAQSATQEITLHRAYSAPHGDKGFARIVVALSKDVIIGVALDEFQYLDAAEGLIAVPSSDGAFAAGHKEGKVLVSKRTSDAAYSKMMTDIAKATKTISANYDAITAFVVGKTLSEIEAVVAAATPGKPVDAVSGATLADTVGYLNAILETAKDNTFVSTGAVKDTGKLVLKTAFAAPNGDRGFGEAVVALEDGTIVAVSIDEFQYYGGTGVPNSDKTFGTSYADAANPLCSKLVNSESYSAMMTQIAHSTVTMSANYKAIEQFCVGKTAKELADFAAAQEPGKAVDAVSGATLAGTTLYLAMVADAAK